MRNSLEDMKFLYSKFHSEFNRLAEYFSDDFISKSNTYKEKPVLLQLNDGSNSPNQKCIVNGKYLLKIS